MCIYVCQLVAGVHVSESLTLMLEYRAKNIGAIEGSVTEIKFWCEKSKQCDHILINVVVMRSPIIDVNVKN